MAAKKKSASPQTTSGDVRAAVYLRISVLTDESTSLESQQRAVEELVRRNGWAYNPKSDCYVDAGVSGSKERTPPEFARLMSNLDNYDRVVAFSIDRFTRRLSTLAKTLEKMKELGIGFVTVQQGIDTSTPHGQTYAEVFGALASGEARTIGERVKTSQRTMARTGRFRGGSICYGWKSVPRSNGIGYRLVLNDREAKVLRKAITFIEQGYGLSQTVKMLNKDERNLVGRVSKDGQGGPLPWTAQALKKVLTNRLLLGYHVYDGTVWRDPDTNEILVPHEPLLTLDEFESLQSRLAAIAETRSRGAGPGSPSLLAGIAKCGRCGGKLHGSGSTANNRSANYRCRARYDLNQDCIGVSCKAMYLDSYVSEWVIAKLQKPTELRRLAKAASAQKRVAASGSDVRSRLTFLEREMKRLRNERFEGKIWNYPGGDVHWQEEYDRYSSEVADLRAIEDSVVAEAATMPIDFSRWLKAADVQKWWDSSSIAERQSLIRAVVREVVVHPLRDDSKRRQFDVRRVEVMPR